MLEAWVDILGELNYTNDPRSYKGFGIPTFIAPLGSIFMRIDGSLNNFAYINTDGAYNWSLVNGSET